MTAPTPESPLALELSLDELQARLEIAEPPAQLAITAARVLARAHAVPALVPRVCALLQAQAAPALGRLPEVRAILARAPSRAAYVQLAAARQRLAHAAFGAPWRELARWHAGAPAQPLPPIPAAPPDDPRWQAAGMSLAWPRLRDALLPPALAARVEVQPGAGGRPRTHVVGDTAALTLRALTTSPRHTFELAHELGHAVAGLLHPRPLPRAVDEAVAAWMARHLEEPAGLGGPAGLTEEPALQRAARARRTRLTGVLAHLEACPALTEPQLELLLGPPVGSGVPWALWHDAGAQDAYLHAEVLAARWWQQGLRWRAPLSEAACALTRVLDDEVAQARALPAPALRW